MPVGGRLRRRLHRHPSRPRRPAGEPPPGRGRRFPRPRRRQARGDPRQRARCHPPRPVARHLRRAARRPGPGETAGQDVRYTMAQDAPSARTDLSTAPLPRPGIMDIAAYVGGESKIAGTNRVIKLASNESALGPSAKAIAASERNLTADVDALLAAITPRTRIVFLANPNNPTGTYITTEELKRLHAGMPRAVLLVLDAAYAEFVVRNDYSAGDDLVAAHDNVVMMRTFSKIYALAALRLGWAYCPPAVADVLNRIRGPFNVSAAAQAAGVAALLDQPTFDAAR